MTLVFHATVLDPTNKIIDIIKEKFKVFDNKNCSFSLSLISNEMDQKRYQEEIMDKFSQTENQKQYFLKVKQQITKALNISEKDIKTQYYDFETRLTLDSSLKDVYDILSVAIFNDQRVFHVNLQNPQFIDTAVFKDQSNPKEIKK